MDKLPRLIASKEEIIKKLNKQLVAGKSLHRIKPEESTAAVTSLLHKIEAWKTSSFTILSESFVGNEITIEFNRISSFNRSTSGKYIEQQQEIQKLLSEILNFVQTILYLLDTLDIADGVAAMHNKNSVFIVHGQDEAVMQTVARFVSNIGKKPIILHEQPNNGKTIIEKFESYANVPFALVLLTPDDIGYPVNSEEQKRSRARQNVIFEFGFFAAKIGRDRVCVLHKGSVDIPSDLQGLIYIPFDEAGAWQKAVVADMRRLHIKVKW